MRLATRWLCVFLLALTCATVSPATAQDTTGPTIELTAPESVTVNDTTVQAVADTAGPDTTAVVWPAHPTIKNFVLANQMLVVTVIVSGVLFLLSQWRGFANLRDGVTRIVQGVIGAALSYLILQWGGTPDPGLGALVTGAVSVFAGGAIFKAGRNQPGNNS